MEMKKLILIFLAVSLYAIKSPCQFYEPYPFIEDQFMQMDGCRSLVVYLVNPLDTKLYQ